MLRLALPQVHGNEYLLFMSKQSPGYHIHNEQSVLNIKQTNGNK